MNQYTVEQFKADLEQPYAWPGGYPRYFITTDGVALSFAAAKAEQECIIEAIADHDRQSGWCVIGCDINWEDTDLYCDHTGTKIESAYGDNDNE